MAWPYLATCNGPQQDGSGNEYCPVNITAEFDCDYCRFYGQHSEELWGDCERDEGDSAP